MAIHRKRRRASLLATALLVAVGLTGCAKVPGVYVYVPAGDTAAAAGGAQTFDATTYVDGIWKSRVLPTVEKDAVEAAVLLPALDADQEDASQKYGHQAGTGSPYAFLVRGSGTVTKVDAEAPTHPATVRLDGVKGGTDSVQVVTGPVIAGTALRDAVGFVKFSDFTNQLDYADAGTQLNEKVKSDVLATVDASSLEGKKVTFEGAFSLVAPGVVLVVPTSLTVAP